VWLLERSFFCELDVSSLSLLYSAALFEDGVRVLAADGLMDIDIMYV
jgi:hypothetical protein